ncbi:MAG: HAMP domain-containing sensor histidine kinase, partial [Salibacteraceae bacterium]
SELAEFIVMAKKNIKTTLGSIDQLLYWITRDKGIVRPTDVQIKEVVEDSIEIYRSNIDAKNARINYSQLGDQTIFFDQAHLDIIARNLLSNSLKHIPNEGTIDISYTKSENAAHLSYHDNGSGIPKNILEAVTKGNFNEVRPSGRRKGTGLGLELVYDLAKMNGASVSIDSSPESGTSITITKKHHI